MSGLNSTNSLLGCGSRFVLKRAMVAPTWRASTAAAAQAWRISEHRTTQTPSFAGRRYSTQRFAGSSGHTSRFRRSGASPGETPANSAGRDIPGEPGPSKVDPSELLSATSSATAVGPVVSAHTSRPPRPQAGAPEVPPKRKPIDTSSKEYKEAASRYVRFVVAFPIFLVTSYFLYQRLDLRLKVRDAPSSGPSPASSNPES